jgi:hypothetical protein
MSLKDWIGVKALADGKALTVLFLGDFAVDSQFPDLRLRRVPLGQRGGIFYTLKAYFYAMYSN